MGLSTSPPQWAINWYCSSETGQLEVYMITSANLSCKARELAEIHCKSVLVALRREQLSCRESSEMSHFINTALDRTRTYGWILPEKRKTPISKWALWSSLSLSGPSLLKENLQTQTEQFWGPVLPTVCMKTEDSESLQLTSSHVKDGG